MTMVVVRPAFAIDTERELGPQLVAGRGQVEPVSWKLLEDATGLCERHLRRIHDETVAASHVRSTGHKSGARSARGCVLAG